VNAVARTARTRSSGSGASIQLVAGVLALAAALGAVVVHTPLLGTAAVLLAAGMAAITARPDFVTVVVVFLFYMDVPGVAVKAHGAPLVIGLLVPLFLTVPLAYHVYRGARLVVTPAFVLVLVFLAAQTASALLSVQSLEATEEVKTFVIEGALLYFLVTNVIRTPETLRLAVWAVIVAGGLLGALSLFQEITGTYFRPYGGFAQVPPEFYSGHATRARLAGPLGDPNYYAQILLAMVPLALFRIWDERSRVLRLAAMAAAGFAITGILLTYSRGAGLAFAVVFVLMVLLRYVKARHVAFVAVGIAVALIAFPDYTERLRTVGAVSAATSEEGSGDESAAASSVRSRAGEMLTAWLVFVDHPVLGVGPGVFGEYYVEYSERIGLEVHEEAKFGARAGEAPERESHNIFLSIAAELGAIGLFLFLGILFVTIRDLVKARRRWRRERPDVANLAASLMLAVAAYVTAGLFLTLAFERYFWLLLALAGAAAIVRPAGREGENGREPSRRQRRPRLA
jgi:putative inorganic carbon (HCO3(-)) transporter